MAAAEMPPSLQGAELSEVPAERDIDGVLVTGVEPGSAAARRGLRVGDIVTKVNRERIDGLKAFHDALEDTDSVVLTIRRGGAQLLLIL